MPVFIWRNHHTVLQCSVPFFVSMWFESQSVCHFVCTPGYQEEWFGDSVSPHLQCSYCVMVTTVTLSRNASLTTVGWRRFFFFQLWGFPWIFQNHMLYHCQQYSVALLQKLLFKDTRKTLRGNIFEVVFTLSLKAHSEIKMQNKIINAGLHSSLPDELAVFNIFWCWLKY